MTQKTGPVEHINYYSTQQDIQFLYKTKKLGPNSPSLHAGWKYVNQSPFVIEEHHYFVIEHAVYLYLLSLNAKLPNTHLG